MKGVEARRVAFQKWGFACSWEFIIRGWKGKKAGKTRASGLYVVDRPTRPDIEELLRLRDAIGQASGEEKTRLERELRESAARGDLGAQRVFVGAADRTAMVRLKDPAGRNRVRLYVDAANDARLEFLDEGGKVVYSIPPK